MAVWVIEDNCTGCGLCAKACPYGAVKVEDKLARILDICTGCGACLKQCKFEALASDIEDRPMPDLSGYKGVWVYAEQEMGKLARVSLELLGEGAKLAAELGQELCAVLVGDDARHLAGELAEYGAKTVYIAYGPSLAPYSSLAHTRALAELVSEHKPAVLLIGATPLGRDLAPRLSRRLDLGLTADCTELAIDQETGQLLQTRPAFGGNVMATIVTPRVRPQMATVRPGVMAMPTRTSGANAEIVKIALAPQDQDYLVKLISFAVKEKEVADLSEAKIVVAGGRGCGGPEGFALLAELAEALGAELAGTRVAMEEGWITHDRQIGQTGASVRPELYIAAGISGAIQHRAGVMGARYIVAVNRDKRAPIFSIADYAIEGDLFKVIPALTGLIKKGVSHAG